MKATGLSGTDWLLVGVTLAMAGAAALLAYAATPAERRGSGAAEIPSSFFNDKAGVMAIYRVWDRLGHPLDRLRRPYSEQTLAAYSGLAVLRPRREISSREASDLLRWVADGGRLLLCPRQATPIGWFALSGTNHESEPQPARRGEQIIAGDPLTDGIEVLLGRPGVRFEEKLPARSPLAGQEVKVLWKDASGVVAMRISYQRGQIILLGDIYPLSNIGLGELDNPVLAANLAAELALPPGVIAFDEYHHGFEHRDVSSVAIVKMILAHERGWAVAQLAIIGLLALWHATVRFGPALDVRRTHRRRHAEFIDAAATLLDSAGATGIAYATLVRHYRERMARLCHLPPDTSDYELASRVRQRIGIDILPALEAHSHGSGLPDSRGMSRHKLQQYTQVLQRAAEALEHATT